MRNRSKSSSTTQTWTTQLKNSKQSFKKMQITKNPTREWFSLVRILDQALKDLSIYAYKEFRQSEASLKALVKSLHLCSAIMFYSLTLVNIISLDTHGTSKSRALILTIILLLLKNFSQNLRASKKKPMNLLF